MELDRPLPGTEVGPGKEREAEIDRGGVQGVDRLLELHAEAVLGVEAPGLVDQHLGEVGVDPPVALLVGDGEGVPGDPSTDAHVVELGGHGPEARLDVPQALAVGELGEGEDQELVPMTEATQPVAARVAAHAALTRRVRCVLHELGEDQTSAIHRLLLCRGVLQDGSTVSGVQIVYASATPQDAY